MNIVSTDMAKKLIKNGKIGVIPTDTVYGLVACADDESAVQRMYSLKKRDNKPGTLIAAKTEQLVQLGVPQSEVDKVKQWWPNPLSVVLPLTGNEYLHQGVRTQAMRVVTKPLAELLEYTGPLLTSSANQPGEPPATNVKEAIAYFGDSVDFYVDGGTTTDIQSSTIVRLTDDGFEVLRQGSIALH